MTTTIRGGLSSEQLSVSSEQLSVSSEQLSVSSEQLPMGRQDYKIAKFVVRVLTLLSKD
jgi:hypothetical protein